MINFINKKYANQNYSEISKPSCSHKDKKNPAINRLQIKRIYIYC